MSREIIAILRGVTPDEVLDIGAALTEAGIDRIEVPLNSPDAFGSISKLIERFGGTATIGAGTVLDPADVGRLARLGARMIVSPDTNQRVIAATKAAGMLSYPGVMTPTEAFLALRTGADGIKLFPGSLIGPNGLKAIAAVLPAGTRTYAVGGVGPENFAEWFAAGVTGFGIGSSLYKPGRGVAEVAASARAMVAAYDAGRK